MKKFSTRLNSAIMVVTVSLFVVMILFFYNYTQQRLREETLRRADYVFTMMDMQVDKVFSSTENMVNFFSGEIEKNLDWPDEIPRIIHDVVAFNPEITTSVVAFVPDYYKGKGRFYAPISSQEGDSIHDRLLTEEAQAYISHNWYVAPMQTGEDSWCNLHINKEDSTQSYISLSKPIQDKEDKTCAVFMAKISLKWLVGMINEKNPFENSINVLTDGKDIGIVYNVNSQTLSNERLTVDVLNGESERRFLSWHVSPCETLMKAHNVFVARRDGEYYFTFSFDMPFEGWEMLSICPSEDIFGGLRQTALITGIIGLLGLLLLYLLSTRTINRMTRPLNELSASAKDIARGNFFSPLPEITSGDEMQELGESFRYMQSSLAHYMDELRRTTIAKERIESELAIAHSIQMGMIPKTFPPFPDRKDVDIYAMMRPAREVGGDLYDYFIKEERLYFIIGDVSGKGVPASLFMAVIRCLFRSVAYQKDTPAEIVSHINRSALDTNDQDMFVTLFVGILDLSTGDLQFCDAGHNPFVLITDSESSFMKMSPNLPVAVVGDYPYVTERINLGETTLLFYTDGLTEAENERQEFYGDERLLRTASRLRGKTPTEVTREVTASVESFVGGAEQSDDLTILTIRYVG